jgi:hypothetical protein
MEASRKRMIRERIFTPTHLQIGCRARTDGRCQIMLRAHIRVDTTENGVKTVGKKVVLTCPIRSKKLTDGHFDYTSELVFL